MRSTAERPAGRWTRSPAQQELEEVVLRLKGLVWVRARLERSGAPQAELDRHTAEIDGLRTRLARLVRGPGDDVGSAV